MKIIDVQQGSDLWREHRRYHFNASDAPSVLGCSPYKTRTELLRELHTGLSAEVDDETQARFDDGHRFEALARPLAEKLLGEDLYPIIKANGRLSASLDGETLDGETDWEHKSLNDELRAILPADEVGGAAVGDALPLRYRVQMAHQQYCSGARQTLFTASKWNGDQLVEARHCWYMRDDELIAKVRAGWAQFERDLADYAPPEPAQAVTAAPQDHLPAVSVQVSGALAVVSNLAPFGVALREFIAKIPAKPSTDQEFADTEAACKRLKEAEDRLQAAEDSALASMADVNEMRRLVGQFRELARTTRLASEKLVKARKEQIREEEVQRGARELASHIKALNGRLGGVLMPGVAGNFAGVIKGLKTIDSLRNAIDTELARCKIEASAWADRIHINLQAIGLHIEGNPDITVEMFPDKAALVLKAPDDLAAVIAQRIHAERQRLEAERARIAAEEAARLERERAAQQNAQESGSSPADAPAAVTTATYAGNVAQAAQATPSGAGEGAHAEQRAPSPPTLRLGMICDRLGMGITEDFLARLGFPAAGRDKAARLYYEGDFQAICQKIAEHCLRVGGGCE